MSSIVIKGNTSGQVEIAAPDVAGSTTLTLPTGTGTVITTNNIDSNPPVALSTASGSAPSYSARAWVNFNGTGTVAIRESGNVSSITDNGTGQYTVNFTTAMPDANYSFVCGGQGPVGATFGSVVGRGNNATVQQTTTTLPLNFTNGGNGFVDGLVCTIAIFR